VVSEELGAQDAFLGGGRYDHLSTELGGKPMPAIGFAVGLERIIELMNVHNLNVRAKVALIIADEQDNQKTYKIAHVLREVNPEITLDSFLSNGSLKSHLRRANKSHCDFAIIVGSDERLAGKFAWKDLSEHGDQKLVNLEELLELYKNL